MDKLLDSIKNEILTIENKMTGTELAKLALYENRAILYTADKIPLLLNLYSSESRIRKALGSAWDDKESDYSEISLEDLPIYRFHKEDVSGSINAGVVMSPSGCGIYRIQPLTGSRAVMHCYPESALAGELAKGTDVQVTVAVGTQPALFFRAASKMRGSQNIPYGTHIIISGRVSASAKHPEGPFITYKGLSEPADFPVMEIDSVRIKQRGVYHTIITGPGYDESLKVLAAAKELFQN